VAVGPFLALVVELYLPPSVQGEGVAEIAEQAYRPMLQLLERYRNQAAVTIAIDPALATELLRRGQGGILHGLAALSESGSAELAAGSKNHALLPLIPKREVERQIRLGDELMREALGWAWRPQGLISPALAYGKQVAEVAAARGLRWLLLDEICLGRLGEAPTQRVAVAKFEREFCFFFQTREVSDAFVGLPSKRLGKHLASRMDGGYRVAVIPAEAFHVGSPALENLEWLVRREGPTPAVLSSLIPLFPNRERVEPLPGSRRTTPEHLAMGIPFATWSAPDNEIQATLWHLASLGWSEAARLDQEAPKSPERTKVRALVDEGLHSAAYRQASFGEDWDPAAVLAAGRRLALAVVAGGERVPPDVRACAEDLLRRLEEMVQSRRATP
jgi:hypothetical protein